MPDAMVEESTLHITVRKASPEEAASLSELGASLFRQTYESALSPEDLSGHIAQDFHEKAQRGELEDPNIQTLLVEDRAGLAGFAQVRRRTAPVAGVQANVELWRIYVDRRLHGRGIGQQLLADAGRAARDMSATGIWLGVWEDNPRAIAFYRKNGFVPVGYQNFKVGVEEHRDLVMTCSADAI